MRAIFWPAIVLALFTAGCEKPVDLTKGLEVVDVSTGWNDGGVVNGQNKLVPAVTFKFKNVSGQPLATLQANVIFRRVGEDSEWGSSFVRIIGGENLAPGSATPAQNAQCPKGYTGTEARLNMLQNSQFVDARVQIFAKHGSTQWQPVGAYTIDRRLLTP